MKRVIILQIMLLAGIAAAATDPNLIGWWKFDEGTGTIAYDSAGGHNGTIYGATWATGHSGGALQFDGATSYVSIATAPELNITGDLTISAWVNFYEGGLGYDGSEKDIVSKCAGNGAYNSPYDFRGDIAVEPDLSLIRASASAHEVFYSSKHVPLNAWHHVVVRDSNGTADFFLDGAITGTWEGGPSLASSPAGNNYPVLIGARDDGLYFNGLIDDVRIYNRALSADEIQQLYTGEEPNAPVLTSLKIAGPNEVAEESSASYTAVATYDNGITKDVTTLAQWRVEPNTVAAIDTGTLTTSQVLYPKQNIKIYADYTDSSVDVNAQKQVAVMAICPQGSALLFDGSNDYVNVPDNASLRFTCSDSFSISAWVSPTTSTGEILGKMQAGSEYGLFTYEVLWNSTNQAFTFELCNSGYYYISPSTPSGAVPAGNWNHVTCVYQNKNAYIYLNGSLSGTGYFNGSPSGAANNNLKIGVRSYGSTNQWYFNGTLDDVRIYNRALSASEIQAIMHIKATGSEPNLVAYWDFDEGSGQTVADVSGHGNNGTLGSSTGVDSADPCWVDSDAPVGYCTTAQMLGRNLFGATDDKKAANLLIADAKAKEQASLTLITDLQKQMKGKDVLNAFKARLYVQSAISQEDAASKQIDTTIKSLNWALYLLNYETDPNDNNTPPWFWPYNWYKNPYFGYRR